MSSRPSRVALALETGIREGLIMPGSQVFPWLDSWHDEQPFGVVAFEPSDEVHPDSLGVWVDELQGNSFLFKG